MLFTAYCTPILDGSLERSERYTYPLGLSLAMEMVSDRVALVGETDAATPGYFRAMMRDFPGIEQLDMVECPGTRDDRANLQVGRMIRAAGLVTHVPAVGSVRSGAVEQPDVHPRARHCIQAVRVG